MNLKWVFSFTGFAWILASHLVICSCGPPKDAVVFAVGGAPAELAFWEELLGDFERRSGIRVELLRQPTDTDQRRQGLVVALDAQRRNPDVFLMDVAWLGLFTASEWLDPLENNIDPGPFFKGILQKVDMYRGHLMALPVYVDGGLLYYRQDLFERFGISAPPVSWQELLSDALTVQRAMRKTNPGFYGFVWQGAQYEGLICDFMEFSGSNGGFILQDGKICINNPRNQAALAYMHDLIWKHRVSPPSTYTEMKEEETRMYFQSGNALFERNWPYAWSLHQRPGSLVRGKIKIAPLPAPPKGQSVSTLGGWHIGLSRFSDCKSRAVRLIQFVTAYETQKKLALRLGWNPGRKDLYNDPDILSQAPHFRELKEVFDLARPRPLLPYYPQVSAITQRHLNAALAGRQSPESALADAQQEISALQGRFQ